MKTVKWQVSWVTSIGRVAICIRAPAHRREARAYFLARLRELGKQCPPGLRFQLWEGEQ
jgi:hypothetical protein